MLMHDHTEEAKRNDRYCPLMKGICIEGWTESMGEIENKRRPKCVAWRSVRQVLWEKGIEKGQVEVHDCTIGWMPDLLVQVANEAYHGAAATEEVRNAVAQTNGMNQIVLGFFHGLAKRMHIPFFVPKQPDKKEALEAPSTNGKGGDHAK